MANNRKFKGNSLNIICIIIAFIAGITNMGWIRVIFLVPILVHVLIFFFANTYYNKWCEPSKGMDNLNYSVCITFLLAYILLPDFGDTEGSHRAVFGIVIDEFLLEIFWPLSLALFSVNIILIIVQIWLIFKMKREIKSELK